MIREVKRIIRRIDKTINPPQFIGAKKVKQPRNTGDIVLRRRLESVSTLKIILFCGWVMTLLILDMIFRFLHHISGGNG
jgi:hypothetical protein